MTPQESLSALGTADVAPFESRLSQKEWGFSLPRVATLQVNVGRLCNLACKHCHVSCGPHRQEVMSREVIDDCLLALRSHSSVKVLDITGGAPEMNPHFRYFVAAARQLGVHTLVRTNLVIFEEPGYEDLPQFYADQGVEIVCSLPFYEAKTNDRQRGNGVFDASIRQLKRLNELGFGLEDHKQLNLVYNPAGAFLPPDQAAMEREYRQRLEERWGVRFHHLYTITNNPVGRFLEFLVRSDNLNGYMQRLEDAFNPAAAEAVMCRNQISVGWDGALYDCDFNQALDLKARGPATIGAWARSDQEPRRLCLAPHCYACTAGSGSSCGGATA